MAGRPEDLREALPGLGRVLRRFAPYMRPYRGLLLGGGAALVLATLMKLAEPWPLKFVIDSVLVPERLAPPDGLLTGGPLTGGPLDRLGAGGIGALTATELLIACALGVVLATALRAVFDYLATLAFALAGNRLLTDVRADLFRHLQRLPLAFHTGARSGDITMRLIGDVGMLRETAVTAAMPIVANLLILVGMIGVMFWLDPTLALVALLPLPLLWLMTARMGRRIRAVSRDQRKREGAMAATAAEAIAGMRTIQALGLEDRVGARFGAANARSLRDGVKGTRLSAGLERAVDLLVGAATALVLWVGATGVLDGRLTPGDLLVFITYMKNTFRPVRDYAKYSARLAKASAAGERVIDLLDTEAGLPDGAREARDVAGAIEARDVVFRHPGRAVLDGLSFAIPAGQFVAITGPSGTGKSTLASLVLRLVDPDAGEVRLDGYDLRDYTRASLRSQISYVPQEPLLFHDTIAENIAMGAGAEVTRAEIEAAARLANAHEFITARPGGYDAVIGERGGNFSAGQRQRLALARAALRSAPVLLLDEPTVGLDPASETAAREAILRLARGRTVLMITHDMRLAAEANRVLALADGKVLADGPPETVLALYQREMAHGAL
ncbi:MAG: protein tyrosine phosphatase [Rhodovulum sulfidophilum]|uniref:Protein tyrosine phosphatase n=1 Tax=Rhodovulum sulfidophilum TaxID=35806 RepID=A0A2W5NC79_RHOSU|nr:MAG: protein tyrosine phosphatase [Rhodovulum sulfidophilum]